VAARYSVIVGGGTSTGKTTFLNALSSAVPPQERIITIEDNAELQLQGLPNLVRLEAKNSNMEGMHEITIRDLIKTSLRMRPDRIIVGEVRGAEAGDFLTCLNTGHDGSLGTAHANSIRDMISRLEMMTLAGMTLPVGVIRRQIAAGIDILVHLGRDALGWRYVEEIGEITGMNGEEVAIQTLYRRNVEGKLEKVGELAHAEKINEYRRLRERN
jgi:pilus assembly protein CpaF